MEKVTKDREFFNGLGSIYPVDSTVKINPETIGGVACHWFIPLNIEVEELILYLHGGSFALGSLQSHKAMLSHFATNLNRKILFVDYSLAPLNPYPEGVNDVVNVYKTLSEKYPQTKIVLMGDSAGGGLAVSTIAELNKTQTKLPNSVVLISSWINLRCNTQSYETRKNKDPILTKEDLLKYAGFYVNGNLFEADPSQEQFSIFPPVFLLVGSEEILFADSKNFFNQISPIQPITEIEVYSGQTHVWPLTNIHSEGTKKAIRDIKSFLSTTTTLRAESLK